MKILMILIVFCTSASCGTDKEDVKSTDPIIEETVEDLEVVQNDNVEIERLDGELDSLLNEIE